MIQKFIFSEKIFKELLSWKTDNLNKNVYYESKKIPVNVLTLKAYQKKIESLFFEESKAQLNQFFKFNSSITDTIKCQILSKKIKEKKFILEIEIISEKFKNFREGDFVIFLKKSEKKSKFNHFVMGLVYKKLFNFKKIFLIQIDPGIWKNSNKKNDKINLINLRTVFNLKSIFKDFQVLKNLDKIPFGISKILFSKKNSMGDIFSKKNFFFHCHFTIHFNLSQIKGISSTLHSKISLIQGPPGTGKTRTILGIIFLNFNKFKTQETNSSKKKFLKKFELFKMKSSTFCENKTSLNLNKEKKWKNARSFYFKKQENKRIIVCAFSNTAIDENTARITLGLPMKKIISRFEIFEVLRLGPNYKFFLDHLTLDSYALIWGSENTNNISIWDCSEIIKDSRIQIIKRSKLIYTTLACAAYTFLDKVKKKEILIIDEAAQAIELSTLVPVRKTCEKLILVGDIQQLPATIFSQSSLDLNYERSLFKRLQLKKFPIYFLETQFRMHPQISSFVSRKFYKNGLKDSQFVKKIQNFHFLRCFGPLVFFDAPEGLDNFHKKQKNFWCNLEEIRIISFIFRSLICLFKNLNLRSIGIISSYQGQVSEIKENNVLRRNELKGQINTVDGFQGREKNIIIFSTVRARNERGIGFLSDCRRMNVAFTRAKFAFWGIGKVSILKKDINWLEGLFDFRKRGRFFCIRKPIERSNRRLIHWAPNDEKIYSEDGENFSSLDLFLINYIQSFFL